MLPKSRASRRRGSLLAIALLLLAAAAGFGSWHSRADSAYLAQRVGRADIESTVTAIGTLQPRRYIDVGAQVSGLILRLPVEPGRTVKRGDLLAEIDPSVQRATVDAGRAALAALRAQLDDQRSQHVLAERQFSRHKILAAAGASRLEEMQIAEAGFNSAAAKIANLQAQIAQTQATQRAEEARLGFTRIYAPMDGTVVSVEAREGQTLNATYQTPHILRIADLGTMTVWTEVSEADVRRVKAGMPVYFTTLGNADTSHPRRWEARVRQVLPAPPGSDSEAASKAGAGGAASAVKAVVYTVLFDVDNADGELMPKMTAQVGFVAAEAKDVLAVPLAALEPVAARPGIFAGRVLDGDGRVQARELRIGVRDRHLAEVIEGLREGEQIVVGEKPPADKRWLQW
ncbi:efflux RND transporter periplasmic adaptor subunit [Variovorax saccharolyticus]|uniref:efflux RND transporter periplasmic adaptor subunit n=1 Tax=Variovorax saccharolyticus TaxID=3053516 RepID=UPI00257678AD|nr:efflux RND transporter periplasmic adaptor subunit [Variovorax sp. J31P216]MDM0026207.1 efflux RND transporter periplasmic adaptor subunit [Variovorax sp. J31P216]